VLAACGGDLRLAYRLLAHYAARALSDRSEGYVRTRPASDEAGAHMLVPAKPWHRPDSLDPEPPAKNAGD
jgi:hypothetical protein